MRSLVAVLCAGWTVHDATVVVSTFDEDVAWLAAVNASKVNVTVYNRGGAQYGRQHCFPSCPHGDGVEQLRRAGVEVKSAPNVGGQGLAILQHVVDHYDALPPVLVFLHGHQRSDHQPADMQATLQSFTADKGFAYRDLNGEAAPLCLPVAQPPDAESQGLLSSLAKLWPLLMDTPKCPWQTWCHYRHAQFAVEAAAVQRHPKAYYERLLAHFQAQPGDIDALEPFWLLIFAPDRAGAGAVPAPGAAAPGAPRLPDAPMLPTRAVLVVVLLVVLCSSRRLPRPPKGKELQRCGGPDESTRLIRWQCDVEKQDPVMLL